MTDSFGQAGGLTGHYCILQGVQDKLLSVSSFEESNLAPL